MSISSPYITFECSESNIDKTKNTSKITVKVIMHSNGTTWAGVAKSGYVTIGGEKFTFSSAFSTGTTTIATKSKTITHNSNGSATVSLYASYSIGGYWGTITKSGSKTLSTINRKYKVTFNRNGGSGGPASQTKIHGTALTLTTKIPSRTGYTFLGWGTSSGGSAVYCTGSKHTTNNKYSTNSNITLYAIWQQKQYTITYHSNNPTGGSSSVKEQTKYYTQNVSISSNSWSYTNYKFLSWNTSKTGGGTKYSPGYSFKTNANIDLYAQWQKTQYTVTYVRTTYGGSNTSDTFTVGSSFSLPSAPSISGYEFLGWTIDDKIYKGGSTYTCKTYGDITFTANVVKIDTDTTTDIPIQIEDLQVQRYTTNDDEANGGWQYKYSFNWKCGKEIKDTNGTKTTTNKTPTTITISDDTGYSYSFITSSTSTSGTCSTQTVLDLANAKTLTITATGPKDNDDYPYDNTVVEQIPYSNEDISEIDLSNIKLVRKSGDSTNVSCSFNWSPYFDGNATHTNYEFDVQFSKEGSDYTSIGETISKTASQSDVAITFESSSEDGVVELDEGADFRLLVTSNVTIDNQIYEKEHLISLGVVSPISTIIHINSTGEGVGLFTKADDLIGFNIGKKTSILDDLNVKGDLIVGSKINSSQGLELSNGYSNGLKIEDSGGVYRNVAYVTSANDLVIGYPWYHGDTVGDCYIGGKTLYLRSTNTAQLSGSMKLAGNLMVNNHSEQIGAIYTNDGTTSVASGGSSFIKQNKMTFKNKLGPGTWVIVATVRYESNSTGRRQAILYVNNSSYGSTSVNTSAISGVETRLQSTLLTSQSSSFNVYIGTYQTSGNSLDVNWFLRAIRIA